jgi:very-short-patch-repair endonuclease
MGMDRDGLLKRARAFRKAPTRSEALLWQALRNRGLGEKFYRQRVIGPFVPDFVCEARGLIVEIDGGVHAGAGPEARDRERDRWLRDKGYATLRVSSEDVEGSLAPVLARIRETLAALPFHRPCARGRANPVFSRSARDEPGDDVIAR